MDTVSLYRPTGPKELRLNRHRQLSRFIAVALLTAGAISSSVGCTRLGLTDVRVVDDPESLAQGWLREQSLSTTCFDAPIVEYYLPPTLAAADKLSSVDRWFNEGSNLAFVGDFRRATFDLVEASIALGTSEAWVMGRDTEGPVIARYSRLTTSTGRSVWLTTSWERPRPESACQA